MNRTGIKRSLRLGAAMLMAIGVVLPGVVLPGVVLPGVVSAGSGSGSDTSGDPDPAKSGPELGEPGPGEPGPGEQRVIIRFSDQVTLSALGGNLARSGVEATSSLVDQIEGVQVDQALSNLMPAAVATVDDEGLDALLSHPAVVSVEPDVPVYLHRSVVSPAGVAPAGPFAPQVVDQSSAPWGLDRIDQRALPLDRRFRAASLGAGVTVYVVDSGINPSHVQFSGRLRPGFTRVQDGRGTGDCEGHGTHVAGTVGGSVSGVAKGVTLVPVRILGCTPVGNLNDVLIALDWIKSQHVRGSSAVVNLSLGADGIAILDDAVRSVVASGMTVVVAAGNEGRDACLASPARVTEAVTVGATNSEDVRPSWSNFGGCVDIFAPGASIQSAAFDSTNGTLTKSGTSMAAPHVSGAAAVMMSLEPDLEPSAVRQRLISSATSGAVRSVGSGSPNRLLFLDPTLAAPAPPEIVDAVESGAGFNGVTPGRVFDSRVVGSRVGSSVVRVPVVGRFKVPSSGVGAVAVNVTAVGAGGNGFGVVWPCGVPRPGVSSVNFGVGGAVANGLVVPVGGSGELCVWASSPVDVVLDVSGWFPR